MPLRARLTLFYTLFLAAVLSAVAFAVYAFTQRSLERELEERAQQTMQSLRLNRYDPETVRGLPDDVRFLMRFTPTKPYDWTDLAEAQTMLLTPTSPLRFTSGSVRFLNSSEGAVRKLETRPINGPGDLIARLSERNFRELFDANVIRTRIATENGQQFVAYAAADEFPDVLPGGITRYGFSFVALPYPTATLAQLRSLLIQAMALAFVVFAVGVWVLSGRVLLPVKRVTQAAKQVSGRDLSARVPLPKTKDEMGQLAVSINGMLARLQESFETQRRFTADASHELRTPVTAIVGHANYLLRRTRPTEEQVDSLTVVRREGERMAKLVNDLLELARADAGLSIIRDPMNLVEVVEGVKMELEPVAASSGAKIAVSVSEPLIEVDGDAARLKQVVLNLVQNAINAGSKQVTVTLQNEKKDVRLEVLDDGPGIPSEALPHLFDRFFRVDGARSTRGNGSGLGLAIVRWIVQQHDGSVDVESRVGEGTVFTVLLPRLNPKATEANLLKQTLAGVRPQPKAKKVQTSSPNQA